MRTRTALLGSTILLAVSYLAAAAAIGTGPKGTDDGQTVATWFQDHGDGVRLSIWFLTFALLFFAVFACLVRRQLPAPHRDIFFFGAIAFAAETAVQSWFLGGLSWHAAQLEPATARTLLDIASFWGPVLTGTTVLMLVPVAVTAWAGGAGLPRWLAVVTGVAAFEQIVETVTIFGDRGFTAPGGPMNLLLGAGLVSVAFVCTGVASARVLTD